MTKKTLLDPDAQLANAREALTMLGCDLYELHHDIEVLAWGCDQLWHAEFKGHDDNEFLSHFPIAVLRGLSLRTGQIHAAVEDLGKGE